MNGVLVAFAVSFGVVFVAELGDKSQLMALTFATRFSALPVLVGLDAWHGRRRRADQPGVTGTVDRALNHHLAGWIALALGLVAVGPGTLGRHRMRRVGAVTRPVGPAGARPARGLFGLAVLLGLGAPLLVATDVVQPVALFDRPRWVAAGAAVLLLGTVMLLSAQVQRVALQQRGTHPVPGHARDPLARPQPRSDRDRRGHRGAAAHGAHAAGVLAAVVMVAAVQVWTSSSELDP